MGLFDFFFPLGDLLQWTPIKAFGRFLINITLKLWSNLLVKHGQSMHICPSNDPVNAVVRKENKFKELGVSSPHTTLVHGPISLYCRDSTSFYFRSSDKANYGSKWLASMTFREHKHLWAQEFLSIALSANFSSSSENVVVCYLYMFRKTPLLYIHLFFFTSSLG